MRGAPIWLVRLLRYEKLSPSLAANLKPEERLSVHYATALRVASLDGRLSAVWTHPANELGRSTSQARGAIARAMGLISGTSDYLFLGDGRCLAQEAKVGRGKLSPTQSDFQCWCESQNVPFRLFTSVEEGLQQLRDVGLLL